MQHPVLGANFSMFNMLNTIAFGVIIFCLVVSIIKTLKHHDKKRCCKGAVFCKLLVVAAFALLIVSTWVSLPRT